LLISLAWGAPKLIISFQIPILSTIISGPAKLECPKKQNEKSFQEASERDALARHDNEIFNALFISVPERPDPVPYMALADLPLDFPPGCLLRMGPMGATESEGFLDGDGMIHCMTFPANGGDGTYSSTYVETKGRKLEQEFLPKKYAGSLGAAPDGYPLLTAMIKNMLSFQTLQAQKDTCNTAIAQHGGRLLALMEQCPPSEIQVLRDGRVRTIESCSRLDGAIPTTDPLTGGALSAHGRTCPITQERIHVTYNSSRRPFVRIDTFEPNGWNLRKSIGVDTAAPVMVHDCAITQNYVVLFDFPLTVRPIRLLWNSFPVEYEPKHGARIGLMPRYGSEDILWFDCEPGVVLHSVNAHEEKDGTVVVHGLRSEPKQSGSFLEQYAPNFLHEWTLDLESGTCKETCLNPRALVEFPVINDSFHGMPVDSVYCVSVSAIGGPLKVNKQPQQGILLDGLKKLALTDKDDTQKGDVVGEFVLPEDWYSVSEPTVIPKKDKSGEYVLLVATHVPNGTLWQNKDDLEALKSQILLLDGDRLDMGPIWTADLPYHVPYGLHSSFVQWETMH
jgi:carotenoid cleavage dioxygenase